MPKPILIHNNLKQTADLSPTAELLAGSGVQVKNVGVMEAQHTLGLCYAEGVGVRPDYSQALAWYLKALKNGSGHSGNNVAIMYANGQGVGLSFDKAFLFWKVAAYFGNVRAMENLAANYFNFNRVNEAKEWCACALVNYSASIRTDMNSMGFKESNLPKIKWSKYRAKLRLELLDGPMKEFVEESEETPNAFNKMFDEFSKGLDPMSAEFRAEAIKNHRLGLQQMNKRGEKLQFQANPAKLLPKAMVDLIGLKPIYLKDFDREKEDHIYEGFLLKLTVIEDAILGRPSVGILGQDENGDLQAVYVYNYPQDKGTQDVLGYGCVISIVNPYLRLMLDNKPGIRIDDPSFLFPHPNLRDKCRCRYCGKPKGTVLCRKCRRVYYCSNQCLKKDLAEFEHNLICMKNLN